MSLDKKLLITDLDNTLYDWVTYFVQSFYAMIDELQPILDEEKEKLLAEFKIVNQKYKTTELPFSLFEIESVKNKYPNYSRRDLYHKFQKPIQAFNQKREETLKLYHSVHKTLKHLKKLNVVIVGHTEAAFFNSYYRIVKLNLKSELNHLYTIDNFNPGHPITDRIKRLDLDIDFIKKVPLSERKPNPKLIEDIYRREKVNQQNVYYIGDSLTRDISMANEANVTSIYAAYGKSYSDKDWEKLVKITHWTDKDVKRENKLRKKYSEVSPNYKVNSYREIIGIIES